MEETLIITLVFVSIVFMVENWKLRKKNYALKELSYFDYLTGIPNKRRIAKVLKREWRRLKESKEPLAIIMLDIDFFKKFNDTYGHESGDVCLQDVAKAIEEELRPTDIVGRYGGEEFIALISGEEQEEALRIAERLRKCVERLAIPHKENKGGVITVSAGISWGIPGQRFATADEFVDAADQALYQAKNSGRNRVEAFK